MGMIRVLFIADTHLGFDFPFRDSIERRRRGPDFFANYKRALEPARNGTVDCVVHGGDILFRSKVPACLAELAFAPLREIAGRGTPVLIVPGNHERSSIPFGLLASHPLIHIFDEPKTFLIGSNGTTAAFSGFPYIRDNIRAHFPYMLERTGWRGVDADVRILCIHHCIEGATVGSRHYTFRSKDDVIKSRDIPAGFDAVLSGHIHRHQVLTADLSGQPLAAPVYYAGSVERTSFAEKDEPKGYLTFEFEPDGSPERSVNNWRFHELPARPMVEITVEPDGKGYGDMVEHLSRTFGSLHPDSVVRIVVRGDIPDDLQPVFAAMAVRSLAPPTMNVSIVPVAYRKQGRI